MTVTGVDDAVVNEGPITYTILTAAAVSTDPNYNTRDAADVLVTNTDNDTAGITVAPPGPLTTTEAGGTATFTVVLNTHPTADVTIGGELEQPGRGHRRADPASSLRRSTGRDAADGDGDGGGRRGRRRAVSPTRF